MTPLSNDPRYPTGKLALDPDVTDEKRQRWIDAIRQTPAKFRAAVAGLSERQFDTPYREGGWTVRQLVHHMPESHANAWIRFKLALTEDTPTIKLYNEDAWAKLADVPRASIESSLTLLDALHQRWVTLLEVMRPEDFRRPMMHPERGTITLDTMLQIYAWHGPHHTAHVEIVRGL